MKITVITDDPDFYRVQDRIMVGCWWCVGVGVCGVLCKCLCGVCVHCVVSCVCVCGECVWDVRFVFWCCGVLCCVVMCGVGAGVGVQCVVCGVCGVCVRGVCVCNAAWHAEKPFVCRFKTSRVYRQNARMLKTCARFAGTHGGVLKVHTETF